MFLIDFLIFILYRARPKITRAAPVFTKERSPVIMLFLVSATTLFWIIPALYFIIRFGIEGDLPDNLDSSSLITPLIIYVLLVVFLYYGMKRRYSKEKVIELESRYKHIFNVTASRVIYFIIICLCYCFQMWMLIYVLSSGDNGA